MDIDQFVEDCITASMETEPHAAVLEVLTQAVQTPKAVLEAMGEPKKAGLSVLHRSATLTIFSAAWTSWVSPCAATESWPRIPWARGAAA